MAKKAEIVKQANSLYVNDFASVLQIIEQNRAQAVQVINHASVLTAWQVGAYVSDKIKNAAWGSKVVQQLADKEIVSFEMTQIPSVFFLSADSPFARV